MEDPNKLAEEESADTYVENGGTEAGNPSEEVGEHEALTHEDDPASVKKRLGMQAKKHQREVRALHDRIAHMEARMSGDSATPAPYQQNPYPSPGQPAPIGMSEEERIQHAVRLALGAKDAEERQAKDAERQAHVHKQYQRLNDEFDRASDKYDDFDDVVRGDDVPFSPHVRDAMLLIENPGEVAYQLGKNRSELERISKLHPIDQAREVNKLSFSLMNGTAGKPNSLGKAQPLGSIKPNPVSSSSAITDKTSPASIRARMKAGTFK